ncbi:MULTISPECIES: hypothetical protein [unclassified Microcoleus]|uniref:hypothetical protein n=1 Tax=unclassified Microcoleus TaxID=2642155 RepID=UPI002FD58F18
MKQVKYRFNRKEGRIYVDEDGKLFDNGNSIKMIILSASKPIFGKPFPYIPPQLWVQLTFLDEAGNWCHAVISNGTTNALHRWILYRQQIEIVQQLELCDVITALSFEPSETIESDREWFDYKFSGIAGKPGLGDRMRSLIQQQSKYPLIEALGLI